MATLHLPKNRPPKKPLRPADKAERALEAGLKGTVPASDPVAAPIPGELVSPSQAPERKPSGHS
jgi:hypothetical protein